LAAFCGKRDVTFLRGVRPSVRPSVCLVGLLTVTHQGQHATRAHTASVHFGPTVRKTDIGLLDGGG